VIVIVWLLAASQGVLAFTRVYICLHTHALIHAINRA